MGLENKLKDGEGIDGPVETLETLQVSPGIYVVKGLLDRIAWEYSINYFGNLPNGSYKPKK